MPLPLSYQLLDRLMDDQLLEHLDAEREDGRSYDEIAYDLSTSHSVRISGENVRRWHLQALAETAERAS